jgi:hypothetical protein
MTSAQGTRTRKYKPIGHSGTRMVDNSSMSPRRSVDATARQGQGELSDEPAAVEGSCPLWVESGHKKPLLARDR